MAWYDRLRYRLMPYIYTLAADTFHRDGTMMRGLVMDFPADRKAWNVDDQYMFGPAFLVAPVTEFKAPARTPGPGIHEVTEYFLVGSFVSWLIPLTGLVLLG